MSNKGVLATERKQKRNEHKILKFEEFEESWNIWEGFMP